MEDLEPATSFFEYEWTADEAYMGFLVKAINKGRKQHNTTRHKTPTPKKKKKTGLLWFEG